MKRVAKRTRDRIPGGLAAGRRPSDFDRAALARGTAVELEHTDDPRVAQEIAAERRYYVLQEKGRPDVYYGPFDSYAEAALWGFWVWGIPSTTRSTNAPFRVWQYGPGDWAYLLSGDDPESATVRHPRQLGRALARSEMIARYTEGNVSYGRLKAAIAKIPAKYMQGETLYEVFQYVLQPLHVLYPQRYNENPADVDIVGVDPEEDWELVDAATNLVEHGPIHISRDREIRAVAVQADNSPYPKVVGSLWDAVAPGGDEEAPEYTFDIDVDSKLDPARRHGVFKRLAQTAVDTFNELRDGPYPALVYRVYVVHPYARALLERLGFAVEDTIRRDEIVGDAWYMTRYNPAPRGPQRLLTPTEKRALFPGVRADAEVFVGPEWDEALARLRR